MGERNYWMIGADGKSYGPTDESTMLRWIDERRVTRTTQVSSAAEGPWRDAQAWQEFAPALGIDPNRTPEVPNASPPPPPTSPSTPTSSAGLTPGDWPPSNLQVVLLIGAILNLICGAGCVIWAGVGGLASLGILWCCCPVCAIPVLVGVLQCMDYSSAARTDARRYLDRTQMWGIINILMILFGNVPVAVCGILQLIWLGDARRKYLGL